MACQIERSWSPLSRRRLRKAERATRSGSRAQIRAPDEPALDRLRRINTAIHDTFRYGAREEAGTQGPGETVELGAGTCRDFAWLMIESGRGGWDLRRASLPATSILPM